MKKMMKGLILSTASVLALGLVTLAPATAGAEGANELTVTLANNTIAIGTQAAQSVTVDVNGTAETVAYDMQDGASVRLSAPTGIRFASFISQADYEGLQAEYGKDNVEIGTIVVEAENYVEADFKVGGANVGKLKADNIAMYDETNGILRFCAAINTLPENVYDTKVYAKSYVAITVESTTYYGYTDFDEKNQRNIDEVATSALYDTNKNWSASERYLLEDFAADADPDAEPFIVDTSSETWLTDTFGANATKVTYTDDEAKTSTEVTSAWLTEFDATTAGNDEVARTKSGVLYMNGDVYRGDVLLVSKVIKTKDDLLNWQNYTEKGEVVVQTKNTTSATLWNAEGTKVSLTRYNCAWNYDGYVVLGANITLSGGTDTTDAYVDLDNSDIVATEGFRAGGADYGFKGIFDGCGYTISGGVYGTSGLFGGIHSTGVVKNLAIVDAEVAAITFAEDAFADDAITQDGVGKNGSFNTDATRAWGASTVIADQVSGTMENCLVIATRRTNFTKGSVTSSYGAQLTQTYVDATDPENPVTYTGYFGYGAKSVVGFNNYATIKNCVFAANKSQGARIFTNVNSSASYENVYIFASSVAKTNNQTEGYTHTAICTLSTTKNETATVSAEMVTTLTADVWDLTEGQAPKFKTK